MSYEIIVPQTFEFEEEYESQYKVYGSIRIYSVDGFKTGKFYTNTFDNYSSDSNPLPCGLGEDTCEFLLPSTEDFYVHSVQIGATCITPPVGYETGFGLPGIPCDNMDGIGCNWCCTNNSHDKGTDGSIFNYRSDCVSTIKLSTAGIGANEACENDVPVTTPITDDYGDWGFVRISKYLWSNGDYVGYDPGGIGDSGGGQCNSGVIGVIGAGETWNQWYIELRNTQYMNEPWFVSDAATAIEAGKTPTNGVGVVRGDATGANYRITLLPDGSYRSGESYCGPGAGDPDEVCVPEAPSTTLYDYSGPYGNYSIDNEGMITLTRQPPSGDYSVGTTLTATLIEEDGTNDYGNTCIKWSGDAVRYSGREGSWESTSCVTVGDEIGDQGSDLQIPQGKAVLVGDSPQSVYRSPWDDTDTAPWPPRQESMTIPVKGLKIMKSYDNWATRQISVYYLSSDGRWVTVPQIPWCDSTSNTCFYGTRNGLECDGTYEEYGIEGGEIRKFYYDCPPYDRYHGTYEINKKDETLILNGLRRDSKCIQEGTGLEITNLGEGFTCETCTNAGGRLYQAGAERITMGANQSGADGTGFTDGMLTGVIEDTQLREYCVFTEGVPVWHVDTNYEGKVITYPARYDTTVYGGDPRWGSDNDGDGMPDNIATMYLNSDMNFVSIIRHSNDGLQGPDFGSGIASYFVGEVGMDASDDGDFPGGIYSPANDPCPFTHFDTDNFDWSAQTGGYAWGMGSYKRWYGYGFLTSFANGDTSNWTWENEPVGFRTNDYMLFTGSTPSYDNINLNDVFAFTWLNPVGVCDNENLECGFFNFCGTVLESNDDTVTQIALGGNLCQETGECPCCGCTDPAATNYDPTALGGSAAECIYTYDWEGEVSPCDITGVLGTGPDGNADIFDLLMMVQQIIGATDLDNQQLANMDCNQDGQVDILDVIGCINLVLGYTTDCGVAPTLAPGQGIPKEQIEMLAGAFEESGPLTYQLPSSPLPKEFIPQNQSAKRRKLIEKLSKNPGYKVGIKK